MSTDAPDDIESIDVSNYSYHREPPAQGHCRYVRCERCGAEAVPARPRQMDHHDGCPLED